MIDLRTAAQQALDWLEGEQPYSIDEAYQIEEDLRRAFRAALAEPETCTWQQDGDSDSGSYGTSCRRYFNLEDGTPEDNKMAWCCYCGKKLAQALITEDEDE